MMKVGYLNAFTDNYIWFIYNDKEIIVIDPGESPVVLDYIIANKLQLKAIVLTHDHHDHMGGVANILENFPVPVYGMGAIPSNKLVDNQIINFCDGVSANTLVTPGHTYTSMCYMMELAGKKHLFCGDTLFAAGCGRVFTGDFEAMFTSLTKLSKLDPGFLVYPGHEYTIKNLQFAKFLEPDNQLILQRIIVEETKLKQNGNTLPVTLATELTTNPFFRCHDLNLVDKVSLLSNKKLQPGLECFIGLRELRNNF